MSASNDTIAAIATAAGEAGIAIVRISGSDGLAIADRVFSAKLSDRPTHTVTHGRVRDGTRCVDEVIAVIMRAPNSYTGEDVVEFQGHGGHVAARRVLRRVLDAGARLAEPGEFTRRAFLNGRIDLLQAEAVLDLIRARSDRAAAAAMEQLAGSLSRKFNELYDSLMQTAADIEATLDFPDDELPPSTLPDLSARLLAAKRGLEDLIHTWDEGHLLREGALVVISGGPNVGKSTMLNTLLGSDRAIVSPIPGTTRDTIEEGVVLDGIPIRLVDTAGLRATESELEKEGIRRTRAHMQRADLHLYVIDSSAPLTDADREHLASLKPSKTIVVLNKTDLPRAVTSLDANHHSTVETCLLTGAGLDALRRAMIEKLESGIASNAPPHAVISERHRRLLLDAKRDLQAALELIEGRAEEMIVPAADRLRSALESIGSATGKVFHDQLLDTIFSRFCIGK